MPHANTRPFAVITGGSNGIGFELARQFAENGYDLLIAAEDEQHLREAARILGAGEAHVEIYAGDLGKEEAVDGLYRSMLRAGRPSMRSASMPALDSAVHSQRRT